jgi:hypothetical protein
MAAPPLRVEGFTDADFNARAPIPIDEVPTAREIRLKHNTWMLIGALVAMLGLEVSSQYVPVGFVLALVMGLLVRETAKSAHENFPLPLYLLVVVIGGFVGLVVQLKGWLL